MNRYQIAIIALAVFVIVGILQAPPTVVSVRLDGTPFEMVLWDQALIECILVMIAAAGWTVAAQSREPDETPAYTS